MVDCKVVLRLRCAVILSLLALGAFAARAFAEDYDSDSTPLQSLANQLPPAISDDLDLNGWLWLADLQNNAHPPDNFYDAEFSLALTKSFGQRIAFTFQGNYINANGTNRADLEQGFVSMKLYEPAQTILTVGKFNANFGVEGRDFWDRKTGTTSLLFGAQPQDLIGFMITQPIGDTGIKLRPFLSEDFQGAWMFDQPPSGGLMVEYQPRHDLDLGLTNWVGPGFVPYGGHPLREPYPDEGYGETGTSVVENWQGPNLYADRGGTLYFMEAKATWQPRSDLMLAAEYLLARTSTDEGNLGWHGWMLLADYMLTDRLHVFGRYSYLNDSDWMVTGVYQKAQEVSCGFGFEIWRDVELRAEYRHDFSNETPDFDSVSVHLAASF